MSNNLDPQHDPRSVDELISAALADPDHDQRWSVVAALQWRGTAEVLHRACELCTSECPVEREIGADILGQLGLPERSFPRECVRILLGMLIGESDPDVLQTVFISLSFYDDPWIVRSALRFASHDDSSVRYGVVLALTGHECDAAVAGLIHLSQDEDSDVRDWATFGLGSQTPLDTPEIREALIARLDDPDEDTRGEAMIGLARRRDPRVVAAIEKDLANCASEKAIEASQLLNA